MNIKKPLNQIAILFLTGLPTPVFAFPCTNNFLGFMEFGFLITIIGFAIFMAIFVFLHKLSKINKPINYTTTPYFRSGVIIASIVGFHYLYFWFLEVILIILLIRLFGLSWYYNLNNKKINNISKLDHFVTGLAGQYPGCIKRNYSGLFCYLIIAGLYGYIIKTNISDNLQYISYEYTGAHALSKNNTDILYPKHFSDSNDTIISQGNITKIAFLNYKNIDKSKHNYGDIYCYYDISTNNLILNRVHLFPNYIVKKNHLGEEYKEGSFFDLVYLRTMYFSEYGWEKDSLSDMEILNHINPRG